MAHNFYQHPGGEDQVFAAETKLLEARGHTVIPLTRSYAQLSRMSRPAVARSSVWNAAAFTEVRRTIQAERIDIAHFHNTFPLISPAAYYAAHLENVPVVQTLHNYRLLCPSALFYRDGHVCEDCLGRAIPWPGVQHACYRGSRLQSAVLTGMLTLHRAARTWRHAVDSYIALTDFARNKFIQGGLPANKLIVKPNFLSDDPGPGESRGGFALFAGRLTQEKGLQTLIDAWRCLPRNVRLRIVGQGPMYDSLSSQVRDLPNIELLGARPHTDVISLMKEANMLLVPSRWYEGFPMTVVEAYACGLPVVASDLGSLSSVVEHGKTGLLFPSGSPANLAACVVRLLNNPEELTSMRKNARTAFEHQYSPEPAYKALMNVYTSALGRRARTATAAPKLNREVEDHARI
jgi:glycosyltransferase involved in cell wall biosynthesis